MRYLLIFPVMVMVLLAGMAEAQTYGKGLITDRVTLNVQGQKLEFFVRPVKGKVSADADKRYTWYSGGQIKTTQGGYSGKLLNGEFLSYHENKNLKERGQFAEGLKSGHWYLWNEHGSLVETIHWHKGIKHGPFKQYGADGILTSSGKYRNGYLEGKVTTYLAKDSSATALYKNGEPFERKKIKLPLKKVVPGFLKKKEKGEEQSDQPVEK